MKRTFLLVLASVVCFFSSTTLVKAATHIDFKEIENGKISTTIHFEDGFVGGVEFQVKVSGNVTADKFIFADAIGNGRLSRVVDYNTKTKVLTVTVLAGGIDLSHNLLNSEKQLPLGTIVVSTTKETDQEYTLSDFALIRIDNSWKKNKLSDFIIEGNTKYTLKAQAPSNPDKPDDKPNPDDNPGTTNPPVTESTTSTTSTTSKTTSQEADETTNNVTSTKTKKTTTNKKNKTTTKTKVTSTSESTTSKEAINESSTTKKAETTNSKSLDMKTIGIALALIIILVCGIVGGRYLYMKNK